MCCPPQFTGRSSNQIGSPLHCTALSYGVRLVWRSIFQVTSTLPSLPPFIVLCTITLYQIHCTLYSVLLLSALCIHCTFICSIATPYSYLHGLSIFITVLFTTSLLSPVAKSASARLLEANMLQKGLQLEQPLTCWNVLTDVCVRPWI
jgi:hypothetical protein